MGLNFSWQSYQLWLWIKLCGHCWIIPTSNPCMSVVNIVSAYNKMIQYWQFLPLRINNLKTLEDDLFASDRTANTAKGWKRLYQWLLVVMETLNAVVRENTQRNMHTVCAFLFLLYFGSIQFYTSISRLLHWHWGNDKITPVPEKQPWSIWESISQESIMNPKYKHNKTKHNKTICRYNWVLLCS